VLYVCEQEMHSDVEAARAEIKRQSCDLEMSTVEKERLVGKLKAAQGAYTLVIMSTTIIYISSYISEIDAWNYWRRCVDCGAEEYQF